MKICPICDTTFDEEIIRFCTKDGTPLIDQAEPSFVEMPSADLDEQDDDDIGEMTVISRNKTANSPDVDPSDPGQESRSERIVIPTSGERQAQSVRQRPAPAYYPPPSKPNTTRIVVLTILGTVSLLGLGALLFWALSSGNSGNTNINLNTNLGNFNGNLNTDLNTNFNFNTNANFDSNFNLDANFNTNIRTPTPTPKPSPTPRPTPEPTETPDTTPTPRVATPVPTPTAPPRMAPRPAANANRTPGNSQ
jgi:hypothetical protein